MNKITIQRNPNGDTRTAKGEVSNDEFTLANYSHIQDVKRTMFALGELIEKAGLVHDYTKITKEAQFYKDFNELRNGDFVNGEWYKHHINTERHHLNNRCPEDVTLIDVIEMLVDCTTASLARKGEFDDVQISDEILRKAFDNTVLLVREMLELSDNEMK